MADLTPGSRANRLLVALAEVALALAVSVVAAVALTWPLARDLHHQVVGGGELGGWIWRMWWHFQEVHALGELHLGPAESLRQLVSLGRYPETGNILDVLLLSYPLDHWLGFPEHNNIKVLLILVGNGLCAYALARSITEHRAVALVASLVAIFNPLVIQDINGTGLRQVLLWWVLLFPIALRRALRTARPLDGALVGLLFTAISAFYWFYGLFTAMFAAVWLVGWGLSNRDRVRRAWRWLLPAALVAGAGVFLFLLPYFQAGGDVGPGGAAVAHHALDLPETTFLLPFPDYDVIAQAPLRPANAAENVLSSLHRVIGSSWPADYILDPRYGAAGFPLVVLLLGVLPGLFIKRARPWLGVWVLFWLGSMGPYLKWGAHQDASEVVRLGGYVVRLPYTWMFRFIPGMSRMFAPYRLSSMMVVASVPLMALGLSAVRKAWQRLPLLLLSVAAMVVQPCIQVTGPIAPGSIPPPLFKLPASVDAFSIPAWYGDLDPAGDEGIIEMPFEQQQDLLSAYQSFHGRRVYYQNWATRTAVPPILRQEGGPIATQLRALANEDQRLRGVDAVLLELSRRPREVELASLPADQLARLATEKGYRWLVVHESGFLYVDMLKSGVLYETAVRKLAEYLGQEPTRQVEFQAAGSASVVGLPLWVPAAPMPENHGNVPIEANRPYLELAVFDLQAWAAGRGDAGP